MTYTPDDLLALRLEDLAHMNEGTRDGRLRDCLPAQALAATSPAWPAVLMLSWKGAGLPATLTWSGTHGADRPASSAWEGALAAPRLRPDACPGACVDSTLNPKP